MTCGYCKTSNSEDDHRCVRCGRRLTGSAIPAPSQFAEQHARIAVQAMGALAVARVVEPESKREPVRRLSREVPIDTAATVDELPRRKPSSARAAQPSLFGAELQPKIIPFETLPRVTAPSPIAAPQPEPTVKTSKPRSTRRSAVADTQATLDFLPPQKAATRTLKTDAEAVIFCDDPVAAPIHRSTAAALDASMILVGFGIFLGTFQLLAKPAMLDRNGLLLLVAMLGMVAMLYGLLFAIAGTVTPGMRWTNLRLINFDGFVPDGRSRALRLIGCWLGILSGGLGLLWALLDEESLTWHDHISKTFPTLQENTSVVTRR